MRLLEKLGAMQLALRAEKHAAWLVFDHRARNPIAARVIGVEPPGTTHRLFYLIPADGIPQLLLHEVDDGLVPEVPGERVLYATSFELRTLLERMLPKEGSVLAEVAPFGANPDTNILDAGTADLLRSGGARLRPSLEFANVHAGPLSDHELGLLRARLRDLDDWIRATRDELASARSHRDVDEALRARLAGLRDARWSAFGEGDVDRVQPTPGQDEPTRLDLLLQGPTVIPVTLRIRRRDEGGELERVLDGIRDRFIEQSVGRRTIGATAAEQVHSLAREAGLTLSSQCVGWPLGPIVRGSHAATFDARGFVDSRELVVGTVWQLALGCRRRDAAGFHSSLVRRTEHGLELVWAMPKALLWG